ncbi:MAG: threonine ammonia-lyase [Candidatus Limnocylindrales bacterium]
MGQYTGVVRSTEAPATEAALVTLDEIRAAAVRLRGVTIVTPLLPFQTRAASSVGGEAQPHAAAARSSPRFWLKPESLQPIGAFKLRGAYNAISLLSEERRAAGVVTHSSGNHAQGVARAARLLGVRAVIVMPRNAPAVKVRGVQADGAEIVWVGASSEERAATAHELAQGEGLSLVPPYDDAGVIAGQGTVGLEIVQQLAELDAARAPLTVLVPVGGGGLAAGVATAVKSLRPDAVVLGVEPALAADARESLAAGQIVRWDPALTGRTIADGMRTASIGKLPFQHLRRFLDGVLAVEEEEIVKAVATAAERARLVLEPSGATALAAALFHDRELPEPGLVVAILTGGNVDPDRYRELLAL